MDETTQEKIEAAAFRRLIENLQRRTDVQNIDLIILAGFCRTSLSKLYMAAANQVVQEMNYDQAREAVYGMAADEWKREYQSDATEAQKEQFEKTKPLHAIISGH